MARGAEIDLQPDYHETWGYLARTVPTEAADWDDEPERVALRAPDEPDEPAT